MRGWSTAGPTGPTGADGAAGAAGATGATGAAGCTSLFAFTQPASLGATVTNVSYTGPQPALGSTVEVVAADVVAGFYTIAVTSPSRVSLTLIEVGAVALGGAVAAGILFYSGTTAYTPADGSGWTNPDPATTKAAIDRINAALVTLAGGPTD